MDLGGVGDAETFLSGLELNFASHSQSQLGDLQI